MIDPYFTQRQSRIGLAATPFYREVVGRCTFIGGRVLPVILGLLMIGAAQSGTRDENVNAQSAFGDLADPTQAVLVVKTNFDAVGETIQIIAYADEQTYLVTPTAKMHALINDENIARFALTDQSGGAITTGDFAFIAFHDENNDGKLNLNVLGKPTEPFIFSNNVKPKLSKPSFEKTRISVAPGKVIVITLE